MLSRRSGKGGFYFSPFFFYMPASRANLPKQTPSQQYLQVVFRKQCLRPPNLKLFWKSLSIPKNISLQSITLSPRSPEMLGRHPRAVKAPVGYFNKSSRNRATRTKVPGPGGQSTTASALDTEAETSPSAPAAGPPTRAGTPTFPFRMTPDPPGMPPKPPLSPHQSLPRNKPPMPPIHPATSRKCRGCMDHSASPILPGLPPRNTSANALRTRRKSPSSLANPGDKHSHLLPIKGVFYLMAL